MASVRTEVEELDGNRVRLTVEVPRHDLKHAVDHAASDLAQSLRIPGFRKGKVPMPVLISRVGKERLYAEALDGHLGGWFRQAAEAERLRPVESPEFEYELPDSSDEQFRFTATFAVQAKPEPPDWAQLEVPAAEPDVPEEMIQEELERLRHTVAELVPVEGRPAREGDTVVIDLESAEGEGQRDLVAELGSAMLLPELESALIGLSPPESRSLEYPKRDGGTVQVIATLRQLKEKVLPPLDDELARAASEFDTLADLRASVEGALREQLEAEIADDFRVAAADALVEASRVEAAPAIVEARTAELVNAQLGALQRRGISPETYLAATNTTAEQFVEGSRQEARRAVERELVLEAVADKLDIQVSDDEIRELVREQAEAAGEDVEETVQRVFDSGRLEDLRDDLRMRNALDRVVGEVKRIPVELAQARAKLWTPDDDRREEKAPAGAKLWTPGSKERV
jgi:trigger factor